MKKLWLFQCNKEQEVEEQIESLNDKNETVIVKKRVKKEIPQSFFIARPNRVLSDDASLYYSVSLSNAIRAGLLTITQIEKRHANDGGIFSEDEKKKYQELYEQLFKLTEEYQKLSVIAEDKRTESQKTKLQKATAKITNLQVQLQDYENLKTQLFDHSAEMYAKNKLIVWWLLFLSYEEKDGEENLIFGGGTLDDRLKRYDELTEDENPFFKKVLEKLMFGIFAWTLNKANTQEEFDEFDKFNRDIVNKQESIKEEAKNTKENVEGNTADSSPENKT